VEERPMTSSPTALVTGASGAIGGAIASELAGSGYRVYATGRTPAGLASLQALRTDVVTIVSDLRLPEQPAELVDRVVREAGRIDVFVHAAGGFEKAQVSEASKEAWDRQLDVHLGAGFLGARAAVRAMRNQPVRDHRRGTIVMVGSGAGLRGYPGGAAYSAAKAGLLALTDSLRGEVSDDAIVVTDMVVTATVASRMSAHRNVPKLAPRDVARVLQVALLAAPGLAITRLDVGQVAIV